MYITMQLDRALEFKQKVKRFRLSPTPVGNEKIKSLPGEFLEKLDEVEYDYDTAPWAFRIRNFQSFEMSINDGLGMEFNCKYVINYICFQIVNF